MRISDRPTTSSTSRLGGWLPPSPGGVSVWLNNQIEEAEKKKAPFHPVVEEFQRMIESDPVMYMYFTQMFEEQPSLPPPPDSGDIKLKNYQEMLVVINHILSTAPAFGTTDMIGFPINAILDLTMLTPAGLAAYAAQKVNDMFRNVLGVWTTFLDSEHSRYVLNDSPTGWLSPAARKALNLDQFKTDPADPFLGFKSWNDFFIRQFKPGLRPVALAGDLKAIVSACESTPIAIETNVKEHDTFWIKSQPYSLHQLLNGNFVDQFVGGTVYQAFLSLENYHRWHSPVSGTIKKIEKLAGSYYSESPSAPNNSQGYIAHVATRALLFIEADDANIGLMCLIPVGMGEVSSCQFVDGHGQPLKEGQVVKKGDQVGYFQYGGSTHCLVFRPGVISQFTMGAIPQGEFGENSTLVKVNSLLAMAR
jgi:phosphatidylserine decarboxylase